MITYPMQTVWCWADACVQPAKPASAPSGSAVEGGDVLSMMARPIEFGFDCRVPWTNSWTN